MQMVKLVYYIKHCVYTSLYVVQQTIQANVIRKEEIKMVLLSFSLKED